MTIKYLVCVHSSIGHSYSQQHLYLQTPYTQCNKMPYFYYYHHSIYFVILQIVEAPELKNRSVRAKVIDGCGSGKMLCGTITRSLRCVKLLHVPLRKGSWNKWRIIRRGKNAFRWISKQNAHSTSWPRGGCSIRWWFVKYLSQATTCPVCGV